MKHYSISTGGFYDDEIHRIIPDDSVALTAEKYSELQSGQAHGKIIRLDSCGQLCIDDTTVSNRRIAAERRLESELHQYVFVTHGYPTPTQATLQAIASDPNTPDMIKTCCFSVGRWIQNVVLPYYYAVVAQITESDHPEYVTWDFSKACDGLAPYVSLKEIIQSITV